MAQMLIFIGVIDGLFLAALMWAVIEMRREIRALKASLIGYDIVKQAVSEPVTSNG